MPDSLQTGSALLNTVLAAPADDAPRLVYADWLDENGEPELAEFIRVQCELARLPGPAVALECRAVLRPRGPDGPAYQAIVSLGGRPAPEAGDPVTLVPVDVVGPPIPDLILTDVARHPWAGRRAARDAEVEVTAVPADLAAVRGRRDGLARRERDLFLGLRVGPVRFGGDGYEVGLPADGQPATVRRGFVDELEVPALAFLTHADEVTAVHPLRVLRLESVPAAERAEGPEPGTVDAALVGRDHWVTVPADLPDEAVIMKLFAAEWPHLRVHLPPGRSRVGRWDG
jgi:uncharacterized protein (TIGR02996 family)